MDLIDSSNITMPSPEEISLSKAAVHLHPDDNVVIARYFLHPGTRIRIETAGQERVFTLAAPIPAGHKIAIKEIAKGEIVRRYGQMIGFATQQILPGHHVHIHNLDLPADRNTGSEALASLGLDARPFTLIPENERRTFLGYERPNGKVGTRNVIAIVATVNCAAHTSREIARYFSPDRLADFPNVDGVVSFTHNFGCATRIGSRDYELLARTLSGIAQHANVGAAIFVSLGCESNQPSDLFANTSIEQDTFKTLVIQDEGGVRKTIQAGIEAVTELLPLVNATARTPQPVSALKVALQCGGSDAWSGVTANPAVGNFSDRLVSQGGTVLLAETTEIYGAEHLLIRRAQLPEVAQKLLDMVRWWETHSRAHGVVIDNNRSAGNEAGGLSTIYEKSLGAVAKGGGTPLVGVYPYAAEVITPGVNFMDSPGYDPVSVTGQVAGGCNLVIFTTGRGSTFGFKPAPSIKISTNTRLYEHMMDDIDLNAGDILAGAGIDEIGAALFELVVEVASGQETKSEAQGIGEAEFSPWNLGGIL